MARKALGRGLEALIPGASREARVGPRLAEIDLDQIRPNPQQPRERFEQDAIASIASSLKEHGVLQPIVVRKVPGGYEIIAGERRWRAAQHAGLAKVPAVIREASPQESLELALVENLQREDLNPVEEARAYQMLVEETGLTQDEVAQRVGRDRSTVSNYLRLLNLPPRVLELLAGGALSMGHARALLGLEDAAAVARLAEETVARGLSVRQVEARVRSGGGPAAAAAGGGARRDPDVAAAERKLARALGTPVRIRGKERGRLEIRFTSMDELNRLYDLLIELGRS